MRGVRSRWVWGCLGALQWGQRTCGGSNWRMQSSTAPVWGAVWKLLPRMKGHFLCLLIKRQEEVGGGGCTQSTRSRWRGLASSL